MHRSFCYEKQELLSFLHSAFSLVYHLFKFPIFNCRACAETACSTESVEMLHMHVLLPHDVFVPYFRLHSIHVTSLWLFECVCRAHIHPQFTTMKSRLTISNSYGFERINVCFPNIHSSCARCTCCRARPFSDDYLIYDYVRRVTSKFLLRPLAISYFHRQAAKQRKIIHFHSCHHIFTV